LDCAELKDRKILSRRSVAWEKRVKANGGLHPDAVDVTHRVLQRMRNTALPALRGGGMSAS